MNRSVAKLLSTSAALLWSVPIAAQVDEARIERLEALVEAQAAQIAELERKLEAHDTKAAVDAPLAPADSDAFQSAQAVAIAQSTSPPATSPLQIFGDVRLRQEFNWSGNAVSDRTRNSLRARLAARYAITSKIEVGARLVTGNFDDPNSTDVTLSDFADDFQVSLDQAFLRAELGDLTITGGKFPTIMRRTDLVWDSDINPQGLGLRYDLPLGGGAIVDARALYFIIEENSEAAGSALVGAQAGITAPVGNIQLDLAASYYDYRLNSISTANAGDFRGNFLTPGERYLSDFNLLELLGSVRYQGLGPGWPVEAGFNYVRNLGAATSDDTGYSVSIGTGRTELQGDFHFEYRFMSAETDAIFAAFSHDNIPLSTNYDLHVLSADYVIRKPLVLSARYYRFRSLNAGPLRNWGNRVRLEMLVPF